MKSWSNWSTFRCVHSASFTTPTWGAVIAAHVGERAAGVTWEEGMRRDILEPLGIHGTALLADARADELASPHAYEADRGFEVKPYFDADASAPAHALYTDVAGMAIVMALHLNLGRYRDLQLIDRADAEAMQWPHIDALEPMVSPGPEYDPDLFGPLRYGPGTMLTTYRGHRLVFHTGHSDGFSAQIAWLPDRGIGAVALANVHDSSVPTWFTYHCFDRLLGLEPIDWSERMRQRERPGANAPAETHAHAISGGPELG